MLCQHGSHIDAYCAGEQVKQWTHQVSVECEYAHACVVTRTQHGIHARETRPLPLLAPLLLMALVPSPGELGPLPLLALAAQPSPGELGPLPLLAVLAVLTLQPSPGELGPVPLLTLLVPPPAELGPQALLPPQPSPGELGPQALLALLVLLPSPGELAPLPLPTAMWPRPCAPGPLCASHSPRPSAERALGPALRPGARAGVSDT